MRKTATRHCIPETQFYRPCVARGWVPQKLRARIRHLLSVLGASYWFLPLVMMVAGVALATLALELELRWRVGASWSWIYTGGSEGARALLSTIAGSVITVGGVVFSITVVTLTQAASQFGPRLLRNFMRDRHNQAALGVFVGTFVYCLLVLRTIRSIEEDPFVPQIAVTGAFGLGLASMAVLVSFLHHTARTLQAPIVVSSLGGQLRAAVDAHLRPEPEDDGHSADGEDRGADSPPVADGRTVHSNSQGYIQVLDEGRLLQIAEEGDLLVRVDCRPGDFLMPGLPLATVWPDRDLPDDVQAAIRRAFILGEQPTEEQDVLFVVRQLVEVAARALSPAMNNPYTAIGCLDWLTGGLRAALDGPLRGASRRSPAGRKRLFTRRLQFDTLVDAAFTDIRRYGAAHPSVMVKLLECLANLAAAARREEHLVALRRQVELVREAAERNLAAAERTAFLERYRSALEQTAARSSHLS